MAAKWRGVSPRSFLLWTFLSPGVFFTAGTEGWGEVGFDDESTIYSILSKHCKSVYNLSYPIVENKDSKWA
jgi:hypothetical protein